MNDVGSQPQSGSNPFSTKQQEGIYSYLRELVGPGPANYYRDVCTIRNSSPGDLPLNSTREIVFHLVRELESSLRALLVPSDDSVTLDESEEIEDGGHKATIRKVLKALDIPKEAEVAKRWLSVAGKLQTYAHRHGLLARGAITDEMTSILNDLDNIFDHILKLFKKRYVDYFAAVDELIHKDQPTNDDIDFLKNQVPQSYQTQAYLYSALQSPHWLGKLHKAGLFEPFDVFHADSSEQASQFTVWPQGIYLEKMAKINPKIVADIYVNILSRAGDSIMHSAIKTALLMPRTIAARITRRIAEL